MLTANMRYGTKIILLLVGLLMIGEALSFPIITHYGSTMLTDQMGQRVKSIAASAAATIDPEKVKLIKLRSDENRPEYQELLEQLRTIRNAIRASGTNIRFIYTIHPSPLDPAILMYGLDAEERFNEKSYPGDIVHGMSMNDMPVNKPHVHPTFRTDQWGTWLIGRYPITDSSGKFIAYLAVDIAQEDVVSLQTVYDQDNIIGILIQCVIALMGALIISRAVSGKLRKIQDGIKQIEDGQFPAKVPINSKDEFGEVARSLEKMSEGLAERNLVKSAFARYVSQQVADSILVGGVNPQVYGERRKITVLFSDVRGFSTISEKLTPEEVVQILNSYFETMVDIIFRHKGTLDKFLGDGLMAIFGAPVEDQFQEENALKAAIEMRNELTKLNVQINQKHGLELSIGIGINSGTAIVGNIGSSQRMEYTAIGDTVNLASRLESKTKDLNSNILISEYTYNSVRGAFPFQFGRVGSVSVKGRNDEVVAYSVPEFPAANES